MAIFCEKCGTQLGENIQFCKNCGTPAWLPPLPQQQFAPPPQQQYTPPPQPQAPPPAPPQQQYAPPPAPQQQYAPPPQQQQYAAPPQQQYAPPPAPPQQGYPQQGGPAAPKKGFPKKLIIIIAIAAAAVVAAIFIAPNLLSNNAEKDFFELGVDKIPTIKYVLGEKRAISSLNTSKSSGVEKMVIEYKVEDDQGGDLQEYAEALIDDFNFLSVNGFDFSESRGKGIQFAKESKEEDFVVLLNIDYNSSGYTLTITRGEGTLNIQGSDPIEPEPPEDIDTDDDTDQPDEPDPPVGPGEGEVDIIVPGLLYKDKSVAEVQGMVVSGITVVEQNANGSFTFRMSTQLQQQMIEKSKQDCVDVINGVYNSDIAGLEELRYDGDDFTGAYMIINESQFLAESNSQAAVNGIIAIAWTLPWVQVYQGRGMATEAWVAWGDADFNAVGEIISPAFIANL